MIAQNAFSHQFPHEHAHLISQRHPLLARHSAHNLILLSPRRRVGIGDRHDRNVSTERNHASAAASHACRGDRRAVGLGIAIFSMCFLSIPRTAASPASPSRIEIRDRVGRAHERVPVRPAGTESRFKTTINHQPGNDCVRQRPQRRSESGRRLVEARVPIEFPRKLQPAANAA